MTTFAHPAFLWAGAAVVAVVGLAFGRRARRSRRLAIFLGGSRAARRLLRGDLMRLPLERVSLLGLAALAVAGAAAEPGRLSQSPEEEPEAPSGDRVELVIDVSASMQGIDGSPTRLGTAVVVAEGLLESLAGSEVGLLLFAGKAYVLTPPTGDHRGLRYLLRGVTPTTGSPWDAGSRLSAGVREAVAQLGAEGEGGGRRAVVLISDAVTAEGEEDVLSAVREAAAAGVTVHTVGVGSQSGGGPGSPAFGEPLLRRMARVGGGRYSSAASLPGPTAAEGGGDPGSGRERTREAPDDPPLSFLLTLVALVLLTLDAALDGPIRLRPTRARARAG